MTPEKLPVPGTAEPESVVNLEYPTDLPYDDGEPLDSEWHRMAIDLLIEAIIWYYRDRPDFFAGGNMFIYFNPDQARNRDYRGPDFFFVWGVDRERLRKYWAVWLENFKYPQVIIELLSPTTAVEDRTTKKTIYEKEFETEEYFLYDPYERKLEGWRLSNGPGNERVYEAIAVNERGWMWSEQLELFLGEWEGPFQTRPAIWLRFFDKDGQLVLLGDEYERQRADDATKLADDAKKLAKEEKKRANQAKKLAKEEKKRADDEKKRAEDEKKLAINERKRADKAEADLALLRARLAELEDQS
jgi:Uma2 family endonuclease